MPRFIKFTDQEDQYLRDHYLNTPIDQIIKHLGRKRASVYTAAIRLGLSRKKFIDRDDNYIRNFWGKQSIKRIATTLKRGERTIKARALELGLVEDKPKSTIQRPKAEFTNIGGYLYLLDKYAPIN